MANTALAFQNTHFSVVDRNGQPWLRAAEIAQALGYANEDAVGKLYSRNKDEFTAAMTETVNLTVSRNGGQLANETRIFSLRGAHLIAMFARTQLAKEFRIWVLDILDRETAQPTPPAIAFDWRAEIAAADSTPRVPLSNELQSIINRRAWTLAHDAYELLREHLARRVAYTCEMGNPCAINRKKALTVIAETTLNSALTPQHLNQLNIVVMMAEQMAGATKDVVKQLRCTFAKSGDRS